MGKLDKSVLVISILDVLTILFAENFYNAHFQKRIEMAY